MIYVCLIYVFGIHRSKQAYPTAHVSLIEDTFHSTFAGSTLSLQTHQIWQVGDLWPLKSDALLTPLALFNIQLPSKSMLDCKS